MAEFIFALFVLSVIGAIWLLVFFMFDKEVLEGHFQRKILRWLESKSSD